MSRLYGPGMSAANAKCDECGHLHTPDGCTGAPTPSDRWVGVSPAACDCADEIANTDIALVLADWLDRDDVNENRAADEVRNRAAEVNALYVETTRETFALGAAWALGDDEEAPAALKERAEVAEAGNRGLIATCEAAGAKIQALETAADHARDLLDGWEHDGPEDPAILLLIQRVREALAGSPADEDSDAALCPCGEPIGHAHHCGSCCGCGVADRHVHMTTVEHLRRCPICDMRFDKECAACGCGLDGYGNCPCGCYGWDHCDHEWLDRPESDTRECLICGTEAAV